MNLEHKLVRVVKRHEELASLMARQGPKDAQDFARMSREYAELTPTVERILALQSAQREQADLAALAADPAGDPEMKSMAEEELRALKQRLAILDQQVKIALLPKDEADERSAILEVRAGTGGEEAALFAAALFRMYTRYAENHGWRVDVLGISETGLGGFREASMEIAGRGVFARLKFESGAHRVQRVPETEASGRIHTSAATVAVLPEAEDVDIHIEDKDLRIDVFRSSGPGGQSVNTTDSAVRITHIPSGIVVSQQDQKSQLQNKLKAMEVLRARLLDAKIAEQEAARSRMRKTQVGTGDRSAKIRTYNYPQNRVTDHRINLTLHELTKVLDGDIDQFVEALKVADVEEKLGD